MSFWKKKKYRKNKFRSPRVWSNRELRKFAHLFTGTVVNISGWKDIDKQGNRYGDYFFSASQYCITNYKSEQKGYQGNLENEIYLDLTDMAPDELKEKFDVAFNHTTLEHVYEFDIAMGNICKMTRDIVILVVPFLQEQHTEEGRMGKDYWRFSPHAVDELFSRNGVQTIYINFNDSKKDSIYIFVIGSKKPDKWEGITNHKDNKMDEIYKTDLGTKIIGT